MGEKPSHTGLDNNCIDRTPKARATKTKIKTSASTKNLLHNKGNNQQRERQTYRNKQNTCKLHIRYKIHDKLIQQICIL